MAGVLYMVATPIGNLDDITLRALETLKTVDRIVAEDTRVTSKLLAHFGIKKPLVSIRARSPRSEFERVARMVEDGESLAYVTDAGTPGISDPGGLLVECVRVLCGESAVATIPGVSALAAAVSVAGIQLDEFVFVGFLPHKKGRQKQLDAVAQDERATILYESPHRIKKLFDELLVRVPDRRAVVCRELTKKFEQVASGTVAELAQRIDNDVPARGEFVVIIAKM